MDYEMTCKECGKAKTKTREHGPVARYCSQSCKAKAARGRRKTEGRPPTQREIEAQAERVAARKKYELTCPYCRESYVTTRANSVSCGRPRCVRNYHAKRQVFYNAQRRVKVQLDSPFFSALSIFERDGWVCGICGEIVGRHVAYPDPLSPSLDHVVPLTRGGRHTKANVQLAHLVCNLRKGARIERPPSV